MSAQLSTVDILVALVFLPVLFGTAYGDLRWMKIPNNLSLVGLTLFVCCLPFLGFETWMIRAAIGAITCVICFVLFAIGWFGGGDAKILPVTLLFVPTSHMALYLFAFSTCMVFGMLAIWLVRWRFAHPGAEWVSLQSGAAFPMGISIAASLPLMLLLA